MALHINRGEEPIRNALCDLCKGVNKHYVLFKWGLERGLQQNDIQRLHSPRHTPQGPERRSQADSNSVTFNVRTNFGARKIVR